MNCVTVKNFGKNAKCYCLASLKRILLTQCTQKSVAIIHTFTGELNKTFFVTVRDDGTLFETYGEQKEIPLSTFKL
ncbi:hypothetical protein CW745_14985 [Psychromonas sp. psych-6C06]|uniref:hypothetical protein n=1 Tax=Psychromonas sp. psych-6C06 TaxID=2058089 RepID=UPI000C33A179|nr:hypothetical protein [Psychromonas sp. psych-6C06]PKF60511.1 hypothetical protein CW745_14985 [Psychromonas sp. psych-6C06]